MREKKGKSARFERCSNRSKFCTIFKCYYALMQGWRTPPGVCLAHRLVILAKKIHWKRARHYFYRYYLGPPLISPSAGIGRLYLLKKANIWRFRQQGRIWRQQKNVGLLQFIISTFLYSCESCVDELLHGDFEQGTLALQIHWNENYGQWARGRQFLKKKTHRML